MFTVTQALEKALFQHFMRQKLDIAYAINKPFPFFEALRDNSFITERMYQESLEACQNLVPLSRVVHNILTKLEKTFSLSLLMTLFSPANLREYPNLMAVLITFRRVGEAYGEWSRTTAIQPKAVTNPAEGDSLQTLLPLPPPQPPLPALHSHAPRARDPRASSQHNDKILDERPSTSDPAVPLPKLIQEERRSEGISDNVTSITSEEEDSGEVSSCPTGTVQVSSRDHQTSPTKEKDDSREMSRAPSSPVPVIRDGFPESKDPREAPQEAPSTTPRKKGKKRKRNIWSTPKKRHQKKKCPSETVSSGHGVQEKLQVVDRGTQRKDDSSWDLKVVTRTEKARTESAQMSRSEGAACPGHGTQEELQAGTQRKDDSTWNLKLITRSQKAKIECVQMSRSEEKPDDDIVEFLSPALPVTCGEARGILYKEKMKAGSSEKCIQNEAGAWFTPKEFLIEGKKTKSKDWMKSVCCRGHTLRYLKKKGLLFCPSRINLKSKVNSR